MKTPATTPVAPSPAAPAASSPALLIRARVRAGGLLLPAVQKIR